MRIFIYICLSSFFLSCETKNSTYIDEFSVIIHEDSYYTEKYKTYNPTQKDISKGLKLFKDEINNSEYFFRGQPDIVDSVYKQYFGYYEEGNKMLLINCMCELWETPDSIDHFNERLIIPDDGGICYFRGYVDLNNNNVILQVNGN